MALIVTDAGDGDGEDHADWAGARLVCTGSGVPQTRTISYDYDGLQRLSTATESGATTNSYAYGYNNAGNRN